MSGKRKLIAGLAGLLLAGGACLGGVAAAPVAGAASAACGSSCVSMYNQKFGGADVSAVSGGTAATGQAITLAAAAPSTAEDWSVAVQGSVSDFYAAGLMNATLNQYYGSDQVYEFEYKPGGISSGECLGIASGPGQGSKVTLQPCTSVNATWIYDAAAANGGYVPYISGSDTKYPAPYVLTAPAAGGDFTTRALQVNSNGVVSEDQMWQLISGVLGSLAAPSNLTVTPVGPHDIRLNWHDNSGNETGFEINNGVTSKNVGPNSTAYTWGGLAPDTYMCFRIRAFNSAGDSAWDPDVSPYYVCTTTPKPPTAPATGKLPYIDQYQGQPKENCDCGAAAAAMIIVAYGKHSASPNGQYGSFLEEIRSDSGNTGVCTKTTTSADLDFGELEAALNHTPWSLAYAEIPKSLNPGAALAQIKAAVDAGKPVIALVHGTDLTTNAKGALGPGQQPGRGFGYGDHFVVVKAVSSTMVTFNDPDNQQPNLKVFPYWLIGGENTTLSIGQFEKALADVAQGGQPYAISAGNGTVGG